MPDPSFLPGLSGLPALPTLLQDGSFLEPGILGLSCTVFRNCAGKPFPHRLDPRAAAALLAPMEVALAREFRQPLVLDGPGATAWRQAAGFLGLDLPREGGSFHRILAGERPGEWMILNYRHHAAFQGYATDFSRLGLRMERGRALMDALGIPWARDPARGFLAADPRAIGSGIAVQAVLCLPGLLRGSGALMAQGLAAARGLDLQPLLPGWVASLGVLSGIHGTTSLASDPVRTLAESTELLLHYERESSRDAGAEDRAWKAWGLLSNARMLDAGETLQAASDLCAGIFQGLCDAAVPWQAAGAALVSPDSVTDACAASEGQGALAETRNARRAMLVRTLLGPESGREPCSRD